MLMELGTSSLIRSDPLSGPAHYYYYYYYYLTRTCIYMPT